MWGEAYDSPDKHALSVDQLFSSAVIVEQQSAFSEAIPPHHFNNHPHGFNVTGIRDNFPPAREKPLFYVGVYALIGLASVLVSLCSVATQYTGALRASRLLFKQLLVTVVRATMRWHDVTPTGRMLNRFSKVREYNPILVG